MNILNNSISNGDNNYFFNDKQMEQMVLLLTIYTADIELRLKSLNVIKDISVLNKNEYKIHLDNLMDEIKDVKAVLGDACLLEKKLDIFGLVLSDNLVRELFNLVGSEIDKLYKEIGEIIKTTEAISIVFDYKLKTIGTLYDLKKIFNM